MPETSLQRGLFDAPEELPYQRHSDTSHEAAKANAPASGTQRKAVFDLLEGHPVGLIDEEIQNLLEMNPSTERPRRIELVASGLVVDSGGTRLTKSGRRAVVWMLAEYQVAAHGETEGGLLALRLPPESMPEPEAPQSWMEELFPQELSA